MNNEDEECLKWCITRFFNPVEKNPQGITDELRKQSEKLDWSEISFSSELKIITVFEKQNSDITVNALGF